MGNYQLLQLLGRGGFAEVYLAEHLWLHDLVAIKVLHTELREDDVKNFQREAQTIATLKHPHIIRVRDFDIKDDIPFLVMDYAPNGSLRQRHRNTVPLPSSVIISYIEQVAGALHYAHERKIIHRDVKPDNMLIDENGQIMLSDFGIAAMAHNTSSQRMEAAMGTIAYMAPEQIQGFPRPASDQYALGIITYEWLCGQRPFQGSFTEIAAQHISAPPPPLRQRLPTVSVAVEQVITKALAKDPGERFRSIEEFADAFTAAALQQPFVSRSDVTTSQRYTDKIQPLAPTVPAPPIHPSVLQKDKEGALTSTERAYRTHGTDTYTQAKPDKKLHFTFSKGTLFGLIMVGFTLLFTLAGWSIIAPFTGQTSYNATASINTFPTSYTNCSYCVAGHNYVALQPGETLQFNEIRVNKSGKYTLAIYASYASGGSFYMSINDKRQAAPISVPTISIPVVVDVVLSAGNNTIALYNNDSSNEIFIDKITVRPFVSQ
jgi:serine/threonine protein kinase